MYHAAHVLSRPEVGFFLRSDERRALALPAASDLRERISQIHGLSFARSLVALEDPVVWGLVSPLAISFPTRCYLRSDLDAAGLKVQVLERIEELEGQERRREKILSELVPATEGRGCDAGAVKGMLGG